MIHESFSALGDAANSPFLVPVAGCLMVLGIVAVTSWSSSRTRELESQERLAAIAKGLVPPPTKEELALTQTRPTSNPPPPRQHPPPRHRAYCRFRRHRALLHPAQYHPE